MKKTEDSLSSEPGIVFDDDLDFVVEVEAEEVSNSKNSSLDEGSDIDFATPYLTHALGFIGIDDVTFIKADGLGRDADKTLAAAKVAIAQLT